MNAWMGRARWPMWLAKWFAEVAAGFRFQRWQFRKYDVAPRLGLREVERRLRRALR